MDDQILDNHKVAAVGPLGFALHVAAIVYCGRNLTDGFVPFGHARRLLSTVWTEEPKNPEDMPTIHEIAITCGMGGQDGDEAIEHVIDLLCEIDLWRQIPHGYVIHDYLEYNPSRETVLAERAEKKAAKVAAGKASAAARKDRFGTAQPPKPEQATEQAVEQPPEQASEHRVEQTVERAPNPVPIPVPIPVVNEVNPPLTPPTEERDAARAALDADEVRRYLVVLGYPDDLPNARKLTGSGWSARVLCRALDLAHRYRPARPLTYIQRGEPNVLGKAADEISAEDHAENVKHEKARRAKRTENEHSDIVAMAPAL